VHGLVGGKRKYNPEYVRRTAMGRVITLTWDPHAITRIPKDLILFLTKSFLFLSFVGSSGSALEMMLNERT
jgi:hypothetical protein